MVRPVQLGHVNIRVRDLERSEKFYTDVVGLEVTRRQGNIVFLSIRDHSHEIAIRAMGLDAPGPDRERIGTNHFAWEMATFDDLQQMYGQIKGKGVEVLRIRQSSTSMGIYSADPDGNENEVYYEEPGGYRTPEGWQGRFPRQLEEAAT